VSGGEGKLPLSVSIIARDEERDLPGALESVDFAAEVVVVVDSATRDRTVEAARSFDRPDRPVRVFERGWSGHVAQKNFALEQASQPWVLALDADERVGPALRREIEELLRGEPAAGGYTVRRRTYYLARWIQGGGWYPDRKLRLVRRGRARWEGIDPHDSLQVEGRVERLQGELEHLSYRDLSDHLRKLDLFTWVAAREKRARSVGLPVLRMLIHPPARFIKMYLLRGGWKDGVPGMIAAGMGTFYAFLKYAKLWELGEAERRLRGSSAALDPSIPAPPAAPSPARSIAGGP
jgi:glycosyltransferase involved in cell wall biosynthesis